MAGIYDAIQRMATNVNTDIQNKSVLKNLEANNYDPNLHTVNNRMDVINAIEQAKVNHSSNSAFAENYAKQIRDQAAAKGIDMTGLGAGNTLDDVRAQRQAEVARTMGSTPTNGMGIMGIDAPVDSGGVTPTAPITPPAAVPNPDIQRLTDMLTQQQTQYGDLMKRFDDMEKTRQAQQAEQDRQQGLLNVERGALGQGGGWLGQGSGIGLTGSAVQLPNYTGGAKPVNLPNPITGGGGGIPKPMQLFSGGNFNAKSNAIARKYASSNIFKS